MDVQGKIAQIYETKEYGSNGFRKREMVIKTEEQYPQFLKIEFVQDKTSLLDNYKLGDPVKIDINLRGREWVNPQGEKVYFNSINGWRIEKLAQDTSQKGGAPVPPPESFEPVSNDDFGLGEDEDDDLPF